MTDLGFATLQVEVPGPAQATLLGDAARALTVSDAAARASLVSILAAIAAQATFAQTQPVSVQNGSIAVTGPLTDGQLRATAVPVATGLAPLTDTQLRASAVPVSNASLPLPTGAATETTQSLRLSGGKLAAIATVTAAGETIVVTPTAGKAIRLLWISATPKAQPDGSGGLIEPIITIHLGPAGVTRVSPYRVLGVAHWEPFTGPVNGSLIVELSVAGTVPVTAHYVEV